ncbi:integrative conjugative element protein, RAQPRD family [Azotobacter vinelandii]|uniref:integrative conjugative element protein, RAQPRD family n=1 Tax=Azotobacter vinelandii TaxID=354 RepID=UPI000773147D|nr:RAQPRD family integrative conjugative element protein [Azotobacter vinelandii]
MSGKLVVIIRTFVGVVALSGFGLASAVEHDEIQQRDLALIQTQLNHVVTILDRLQARQSAQGRRDLYLDIPRLRRDLDAIQKGLDDYLSPDRMPPRQLEPIEADFVGDYIRKLPQ